MSSELSVRPASRSDAEAVRSVAERSMRASYDLSPQEITAVAEALFDDAYERTVDADDRLQLVAERHGSVVGFVQGDVAAPPTLVWLHVHPDYRGEGVGTRLFERGVEALRERADDPVRAVVASSAREGNEFFASLGFEKAGERDRTIGSLTVTEEVYAPSDSPDVVGGPAAGAASEEESEEAASQTADAGLADADVPETVTDGDEEVYVGDEGLAGTEGPFAQTYSDEARSDAYGYYCANCGSTDVSMGSMEALECGDCGNEHRPDDDYDGAYL